MPPADQQTHGGLQGGADGPQAQGKRGPFPTFCGKRRGSPKDFASAPADCPTRCGISARLRRAIAIPNPMNPPPRASAAARPALYRASDRADDAHARFAIDLARRLRFDVTLSEAVTAESG
jgi:transglutaminase-like putative cysteine protease